MTRPAAFVVLVLPVVLAACGEPAREAETEGPPVAVAAAPVEISDWSAAIEAGGVILARNTAIVSSRLVAPVEAVHVRAGDRVRRGQPLVELDAAELGAASARATSATRAAEQTVAAAEADRRGAESGLALARVTHERIAALEKQRSATRQELDQAQAALAAAEARLTGADARVREAQAAREASLAAARAAEVAASYGVLTAPFDGVISERSVDPGTMATPGMPLVVVEDPVAFQMEVKLDATRAALVALNDTLAVRLDGDESGVWIDGRVREIDRIDPAAHSFAVKIDLPASPLWRSGLFGRARLHGTSRKVHTVPASAIMRRGQLSYAFVVTADKHAQLRPVSVGAAAAGRVEVLDGLESGDIVVLEPPAALKDGSPVTLRAGGTTGATR